LAETASYKPSCVNIGSAVFAVGDDKNKKEKERKIPQNRYISRICREAPCEPILAKFCTSREMADVITCTNFGVNMLRDYGYTVGRILASPIEMASHPCSLSCDVVPVTEKTLIAGTDMNLPLHQHQKLSLTSQMTHVVSCVVLT